MPEYNVKYHSREAAEKYQQKIEKKRRFSTQLELNMVRKSLGDVEGEKILDCPCGTGRIDPILREKFTDIQGMDNAQSMLDVYLDGHPERKAQMGDIFNLPFADNEFDWAVCHRLFHHFKSDEQRIGLLRSLSRVSRHGFTFYAWIDTPFSKRGRKSTDGRQSIPRKQLDAIISQVPCRITNMYRAGWPFSPKVMFICRNN